MAKVKFSKLTLGHPLTKEAVWGNLDQCAAALSGNITAAQRKEARSVFSVVLQKARSGPSIAEPEGEISSLGFFLPPLQEFFSDSLTGDLNTPDIVLESLSVSFDCANQQYPIGAETGLPDPGLKFDTDLVVAIKVGSFSAQATIPKSTLNIMNDEIINRPNPTLSADIGAVIDPYSRLEITVRHPFLEQYIGAGWAGFDQLLSIDNLVIHATFSAPIVQRDSLAHTVLPQNSPIASGAARSAATCALSSPAAGSLIKAGDRESAATDGIQDAFEQLDLAARNKLRGGLTRSSEVRPFTESLVEDQGYFCISIPLFNIAENNILAGTTPATRLYDGYVRPSVLRGANALMDRAVIPIVAPGTIHHVGVFWDKFESLIPPYPTTNPNDDFRMDLGVAIGCGPGSITDSYTQVCQVEEKSVTYNQANEYRRHFFAPIAYSTAAAAPAEGSGYVTQGRPFFFGREVDMTGGVRRNNAAYASNPAASEAAPATNGTEQFIEVRCNLYRYNTVTLAYGGIEEVTMPNSNLKIAGWSGVVVCLYGKMALVE